MALRFPTSRSVATEQQTMGNAEPSEVQAAINAAVVLFKFAMNRLNKFYSRKVLGVIVVFDVLSSTSVRPASSAKPSSMSPDQALSRCSAS